MVKNILLISEDIIFSSEIVAYFSAENYNISCSNYTICVKQLDNYKLIILDLGRSKFCGSQLFEKFRLVNQIPIIILAAVNDNFDRIFSLESGFDEYLTKNIQPRELLARINIIIKRAYNSSLITNDNRIVLNNLSVCRSNRQVVYDGVLIDLTGIEFEILYLLMSNSGKILSREKIGEELYQRIISRHDRSIDMHICSIRKKLASNINGEKIKTIRGVGYLFLQKNEYDFNKAESLNQSKLNHKFI